MAVDERHKKVLWFLIYLLWIVADVEFLWGWDSRHVTFLLAASAGTIALCFAECSFVVATYVSLAAIIVALAIFNFAPPYAIPNIETVGALYAANEPIPPTVCTDVPEDAIYAFLGPQAFVHKPNETPMVLIQRGTDRLLTADRSADGGLAIETKVFDATGALVGVINKGTFHVITGERSSITRSDLSTLAIYDGEGKELLYVRYLNPRAIRVRGIFGPVTITDDKVRMPGITLGVRMCAQNTRADLVIE